MQGADLTGSSRRRAPGCRQFSGAWRHEREAHELLRPRRRALHGGALRLPRLGGLDAGGQRAQPGRDAAQRAAHRAADDGRRDARRAGPVPRAPWRDAPVRGAHRGRRAARRSSRVCRRRPQPVPVRRPKAGRALPCEGFTPRNRARCDPPTGANRRAPRRRPG